MDEHSLTPSDLFSPSKARQQRAQAQDWAYVDSWLSTKYLNRNVPPFERNEDTLKVLLALAAANERADEERDMIITLEREALRELEEAEVKQDIESTNASILTSLSRNLTPEGQSSLTTLVSLSNALDSPNADTNTLAQTIIARTTTTATLSQHLTNTSTLRTAVEASLENLTATLHTLQTLSPSSTLAQQTTLHTRQTKHLRSKLREYTDRLAALPNSSASLSNSADITSSISLERLVSEENALNKLRQNVEELESEVNRFKGLPANKDEARREVRKAESELERLKGTREQLFRGMVG